MRTDLFDYFLPPEQIAQTPLPRGESRLLVLHRENGQIEHRHFPALLDYLQPGDTLVLNDTRVSARRLRAVRESGQPAEIMLLRPIEAAKWETLVKPGKALKPGKTVTLFGPEGQTVTAQVIATTAEGGRILEFDSAEQRDSLALWGETPLPPYIHTPLAPDEEERYQTVYSAHQGSAAAPTAGLHFTPTLLRQAEAKGVRLAYLTLHVGVGTFRPIRTEDTADHIMHHETVLLGSQCAEIVNSTTGRVIAVGTTCVRALESAAARAEPGDGRLRIVPFVGETNLFITPGYTFRVVDGMVTNFHLPMSTLLMLVSAFATREMVLNAYAVAVQEKYRFFSFGDAMLVL